MPDRPVLDADVVVIHVFKINYPDKKFQFFKYRPARNVRSKTLIWKAVGWLDNPELTYKSTINRKTYKDEFKVIRKEAEARADELGLLVANKRYVSHVYPVLGHYTSHPERTREFIWSLMNTQEKLKMVERRMQL